MQVWASSSSFQKNTTSSLRKLEPGFHTPSTCLSTDHEATEATAATETVGDLPVSAQNTLHLRCGERTRQKPGLQNLPGAAYSEDRELQSSKSENCSLS